MDDAAQPDPDHANSGQPSAVPAESADARQAELDVKNHLDDNLAEQPAEGFRWIFEKMGGVYQVAIRTCEDICRVGQLDPKIWVALSCPAAGLEFDQRTLTLVDTDRDGRIRIPEIIQAVDWITARINDPAEMTNEPAALPLACINLDHPDGPHLLSTARAILRNLGRYGAEELTGDDINKATANASEQEFNGDGILPPLGSLDEEVKAFVQDALDVVGGVEDASGRAGVNMDIAAAFVSTLAALREWQKSVANAHTELGANTAEAWELIEELAEKIDDYFLRCELAAYAPESIESLNPEEKLVPAAAEGVLSRDALAGLPLAHVDSDKPLNLAAGINPAWRDRIERFAELLQPLLTAPGTLTRADWKTIRTRFSSYAGALANKPVPAKPPVVFAPTKTPDSLGTERIDVILSSGVMEKFKKLAEEDARMPAAASDIAAVERLYRYYRHLYRLLLNFVSFEDFYTQRRTASFQSGSLLIDGRACHLCMPAVNIDEHAAMAARSQLFLLYCKCSRGVKPGTTEPAETRNIVAAVTSGDSDLLLESRNGVFVDNLGEDWDAKVVKVVSNPIGLWEAIWSPYKRFGNMVTDAISKYANEKQAGLMASATKTIDQIGTTSGAPPTFDMSKNIGIFAAVGIALGAIGTALGSLASAFFAMAWWQFPLIFIGLFLLISGPSVLMAWLKLRQRTLGPLLEASGWAVNGKMALNYTMATKLTRMGELPENVTLESGLDVERIKRLDRKVFWYAVLIGAALALAISLYVVHRNAVNRAVRAVDGASTHQVRESARQAVEELARSLKSASHFAETPAAAPAAAAAAQSAAEAPAPASTPSPAPAPEPTPPPAPDPAPAPVAAEPAPPPAT